MDNPAGVSSINIGVIGLINILRLYNIYKIVQNNGLLSFSDCCDIVGWPCMSTHSTSVALCSTTTRNKFRACILAVKPRLQHSCLTYHTTVVAGSCGYQEMFHKWVLQCTDPHACFGAKMVCA
jgi:hypothetical protein